MILSTRIECLPSGKRNHPIGPQGRSATGASAACEALRLGVPCAGNGPCKHAGSKDIYIYTLKITAITIVLIAMIIIDQNSTTNNMYVCRYADRESLHQNVTCLYYFFQVWI
jgi:hypothetical protein